MVKMNAQIWGSLSQGRGGQFLHMCFRWVELFRLIGKNFFTVFPQFTFIDQLVIAAISYLSRTFDKSSSSEAFYYDAGRSQSMSNSPIPTQIQSPTNKFDLGA